MLTCQRQGCNRVPARAPTWPYCSTTCRTLSDFTLMAFHQQPDHAKHWAGKYIAVFKRPPMTYVIIYNEDRTPRESPKSLDLDTVEALRTLLPEE